MRRVIFSLMVGLLVLLGRAEAGVSFQGLGDLPDGPFKNWASAVSADGSVVVGWSYSAAGLEAFIWDEARGLRNLREVLITDHGLDLTGWTLTSAMGLSADGLTIVGHGSNPLGQREAWRAVIPEPATGLK